MPVPVLADCSFCGMPTPSASMRKLRFDLIVPAHNEEAILAHVIGSLLRGRESKEWVRTKREGS
jgi:hypothetical protein